MFIKNEQTIITLSFWIIIWSRINNVNILYGETRLLKDSIVKNISLFYICVLGVRRFSLGK